MKFFFYICFIFIVWEDMVEYKFFKFVVVFFCSALVEFFKVVIVEECVIVIFWIIDFKFLVV